MPALKWQRQKGQVFKGTLSYKVESEASQAIRPCLKQAKKEGKKRYKYGAREMTAEPLEECSALAGFEFPVPISDGLQPL